VTGFEEEVATLRASLAARDEELLRRTSSLAVSDEAAAATAADVGAIRVALEDAREVVATRDAAVVALESRVSSLDSELGAARSSGVEALASLRLDAAALRQTLLDKEAALASAREDLAKQAATSTEREAALDAEADTLRSQLYVARNDLAAAQAAGIDDAQVARVGLDAAHAESTRLANALSSKEQDLARALGQKLLAKTSGASLVRWTSGLLSGLRGRSPPSEDTGTDTTSQGEEPLSVRLETLLSTKIKAISLLRGVDGVAAIEAEMCAVGFAAKEVAQLEAELVALKQSTSDAKAQGAVLIEAKAAAETALAAASAYDDEARRLSDEVSTLTGELAAAAAAAAADRERLSSEARATSAALEEEVSRARVDADALRAELALAASATTSATQDAAAAIAAKIELGDRIEALETDADVAASQSGRVAADLTAVRAQLAAKDEELRDAMAVADRLGMEKAAGKSAATYWQNLVSRRDERAADALAHAAQEVRALETAARAAETALATSREEWEARGEALRRQLDEAKCAAKEARKTAIKSLAEDTSAKLEEIRALEDKLAETTSQAAKQVDPTPYTLNP
jgi:chromosome segregation ATPase